MHRVFVLAAAAGLAAVAADARAWEPDTTGAQLALDVGAGGPTRDWFIRPFPFDTGTGFGVGPRFLYRPIPYLAAGIGFLFDVGYSARLPASSAGGVAMQGNLAVEGTPLAARWYKLDPFLGVSVGYSQWAADVSNQGTLRVHGIGVGFRVGARYYVTRFLSVGPLFEYTWAKWLSICPFGRDCTELSKYNSVDPEKTTAPGLYFVGVQSAFHL